MSLSTSKSKTQLAYARSGKAVNKPKGKNSSTLESNELSKGRHPARNSTGNIYDSIMGQIEPKQQDYIKSLIVKNERQSIKQEKHSEKQSSKNGLNNESKKARHNTGVSSKLNKQPQNLKKLTSSSTTSHERTRSQAQLIIKDSGLASSNQTGQSIIHSPSNKQNTQISCNDSQVREDAKYQQFKPLASPNSKQIQYSLQKSEQSTINQNKSTEKNPIIQALNNTSSSFAKKLEAFELQYPNQQREERSTHKKVCSRLSGQYFSCQASPKNTSKNTYTKEIVITTKPHNNYNINTNEEPISANISPISQAKNSNQKNNKKLMQNLPTIGTNFISCLDEYLQALTYNSPQFQQQHNCTSAGKRVNMKRSNSSKFKQFSTSKGHPFTLGKQQEQEQTIVLQNGVFNSKTTTKIDDNKLFSFNQQQKILKQLSVQRKKVSQLNSLIEIFHQQLSKYKKKQRKLKQNQYHMIEVMKELNQQLTQERNQRRKLEGVVSDFESKIRGISRGKEKKRRESVEDLQRPERKTIYGGSMANSMQYNNYQQGNKNKLQKHSKQLSNNRFSSIINSMNNEHQLQGNDHEAFYLQNRQHIDEGLSKNKTQKFSKIISNFQLENQPCDEDDEMYFRSKNLNNSLFVRDSAKHLVYQHQPASCKKSAYFNSSMPIKGTRSRPMTPKLVEELFKSTKNFYKNPPTQQYNYASQQSEEQLSAVNINALNYNQQINRNYESQGSQSEFKTTQMSQEEFVQDERANYHQMLKRMR